MNEGKRMLFSDSLRGLGRSTNMLYFLCALALKKVCLFAKMWARIHLTSHLKSLACHLTSYQPIDIKASRLSVLWVKHRLFDVNNWLWLTGNLQEKHREKQGKTPASTCGFVRNSCALSSIFSLPGTVKIPEKLPWRQLVFAHIFGKTSSPGCSTRTRKSNKKYRKFDRKTDWEPTRFLLET